MGAIKVRNGSPVEAVSGAMPHRLEAAAATEECAAFARINLRENWYSNLAGGSGQ